MTETERLRIRMLDWLLDYECEHPDRAADASELIGNERILAPAERDIWRSVMAGLRSDGLITLLEPYGVSDWVMELTSQGRREAEARRARRTNPAMRRAAARDGVLAWLYDQPEHRAHDVRPFPDTRYAYFEGQQLGLSDAEDALGYLYRQGLLTGVGGSFGVLRPKLTDAGLDCVDHYGGAVSAYVRRNDEARTSNTLNIGSISGSNLAVGNRDVAQKVQTGASGAEIAVLLRAIIEAIPTLALSPQDETDLRDAVRMADSELEKPDPDKGWAKSLLGRVSGVLGKSVETALGPVLAAYLKVLAKEHGIDLGE